MDVASRGPIAVTSVVWQPRPGAFVLTVAGKTTYRLEPGVSPLADAPEEARAFDTHWDDDAGASVYAPGDGAPYKPRADVVLVGSAHAPGGLPVRSLIATLQVGDVQKSIAVVADRALSYDGRLLEGPAFTRMPLRWERAAGGPETTNPVGLRFDARPDADGRVALPNLQPPWKTIARPGDTFEPVGFGPIAPAWPARAWLLHRHLGGWSHARWYERPLPPDLDGRYFNVAPPDQQTDTLPPDARIALENLHPRHGRLVTNLARVRPRAAIERPGRAPEPLALTPDTLWIDTDRAIATLTFRGSAALAHAGEPGRVVVSVDDETARPRPALTVPGGRADGPALPFAAAKALAAAPAPPAKRPAATSFDASRTLAIEDRSEAAPRRAATLPFVKGPPPPPSPPPREPLATELLDASLSFAVEEAPESGPPRAATLPFVKGSPPRRSAWGEESTAVIDVDRIRAGRGALPFVAAADDDPPEAETLRPPAPEAAPAVVLPKLPSLAAFAVPDDPAPVATPKPPAPLPAEPEAKPLPVEIYAAVKVAFWRAGDGSAGIEEALRAHGLDEEDYRAGEERLLEALAEDARAGRTALARALRAAIKDASRAAAQ